MKDNLHKKIYFLRVNDTATKLNGICHIIQTHFERKEAILIAVPSQDAAVYIDQLLWRQPEECFIPHSIVKASTKELVAITTADVNCNNAKVMLNLRSDIPNCHDAFDKIYDLLDLTHPAKEQLSRNRLSAYNQLGYAAEELA